MAYHQKIAFVLISMTLVLAIGCTSETRRTEGTSPGLSRGGAVEFPGMQLRHAGDNASFTLVGRARNRSAQQTITEIKLRLTMEDVLLYGTATTVGEVFLVLKLEIPPGQSKNFSENISFARLPAPKGRHEWDYSVVGMTVKK